MPEALQQKSKKFYGWWIVACCLLCQGFGMGLVGVYGLFLLPLAAEFNADMSTLAIGMSIYLLCMGGTAPLVGIVMKPGRIKRFMLAGVILASICLALMGSVDSLGVMAVMIACFAFTAAGFGHLPNNILLSNWFDRLRGRAMAISAMGSSVASFTLPPLTAWWITHYGWRTAFELLGLLLICLLVPVITLLVVERPELLGQHADGQDINNAKSMGVVEKPVSVGSPVPNNKALLGDKNFWLIGILFGLFYTTAITQAVHFIPYLVSMDLTTQEASWVIAALGGAGMIGKLISGILGDILRQRILWLVLSLQLIPMVAWLSLSQFDSFGILTLFSCCLLGFAGGGMIPMHAFVNSLYFGPSAVGRVTGFHSPMLLPAGLFAAPLAGWAIDMNGNYSGVFISLAVALMVSSVVCLSIGKPGIGST